MLAPLLDDPPRLLPTLGYNGVYNVLDFPVGSVPIDNFTKKDEVYTNFIIRIYTVKIKIHKLH